MADNNRKYISIISKGGYSIYVKDAEARTAIETSFGFTATPSPVLIGSSATITLLASIGTTADIIIKRGDTSIASGSGISLGGSDTITPTANITYTAKFTVGSIEKVLTAEVVAVHPIYYGAGAAYTDINTQASARTSAKGTYSIVNSTSGSYIWFLVPSAIEFNGAMMSGIDFPFVQQDNVTINEVVYKVYKSANNYNTGTLVIEVS